MKKSLSVVCLLASVLANAETRSPEVIYGKDDRYDLYAYPNKKVVELARSTVALVKTNKLIAAAGVFSLPMKTFQEDDNVCSTERFAKQPIGAFCSGFLIAPNKIVTAGHCIEDESECAETSFVFDYAMKDASTPLLSFADNKVYSCKRILGHKFEGSGEDYAVIELDRPVMGRTPVKLSANTNLKPGDGLLVIGHPSGLPSKITDNAKVRVVKKENGFFMANLDTYGGNSGSAVFNSRTHEVEGILVRGERDFIDTGDCIISNVIGDDEGRGEDVTLISHVKENGFDRPAPETSGEAEFIYLDSDRTCNEFRGNHFIREVSNSYCI